MEFANIRRWSSSRCLSRLSRDGRDDGGGGGGDGDDVLSAKKLHWLSAVGLLLTLLLLLLMLLSMATTGVHVDIRTRLTLGGDGDRLSKELAKSRAQFPF